MHIGLGLGQHFGAIGGGRLLPGQRQLASPVVEAGVIVHRFNPGIRLRIQHPLQSLGGGRPTPEIDRRVGPANGDLVLLPRIRFGTLGPGLVQTRGGKLHTGGVDRLLIALHQFLQDLLRGGEIALSLPAIHESQLAVQQLVGLSERGVGLGLRDDFQVRVGGLGEELLCLLAILGRAFGEAGESLGDPEQRGEVLSLLAREQFVEERLEPLADLIGADRLARDLELVQFFLQFLAELNKHLREGLGIVRSGDLFQLQSGVARGVQILDADLCLEELLIGKTRHRAAAGVAGGFGTRGAFRDGDCGHDRVRLCGEQLDRPRRLTFRAVRPTQIANLGQRHLAQDQIIRRRSSGGRRPHAIADPNFEVPDRRIPPLRKFLLRGPLVVRQVDLRRVLHPVRLPRLQLGLRIFGRPGRNFVPPLGRLVELPFVPHHFGHSQSGIVRLIGQGELLFQAGGELDQLARLEVAFPLLSLLIGLVERRHRDEPRGLGGLRAANGQRAHEVFARRRRFEGAFIQQIPIGQQHTGPLGQSGVGRGPDHPQGQGTQAGHFGGLGLQRGLLGFGFRQISRRSGRSDLLVEQPNVIRQLPRHAVRRIEVGRFVETAIQSQQQPLNHRVRGGLELSGGAAERSGAGEGLAESGRPLPFGPLGIGADLLQSAAPLPLDAVPDFRTGAALGGDHPLLGQGHSQRVILLLLVVQTDELESQRQVVQRRLDRSIRSQCQQVVIDSQSLGDLVHFLEALPLPQTGELAARVVAVAVVHLGELDRGFLQGPHRRLRSPVVRPGFPVAAFDGVEEDFDIGVFGLGAGLLLLPFPFRNEGGELVERLLVLGGCGVENLSSLGEQVAGLLLELWPPRLLRRVFRFEDLDAGLLEQNPPAPRIGLGCQRMIRRGLRKLLKRRLRRVELLPLRIDIVQVAGTRQ